MTELLSLGGVGLILGFRHAFEPDHLAAVSTLATKQGGWRAAARLGAAWGAGHSASVGAAVLLLVLLDLRLPEALHRAAELLVAALLILLGGATVLALARRGEHPEPRREMPADPRNAGPRNVSPRNVGPRNVSKSFGFGLAHGLAGSGPFVVLLAAAAATGAERLACFLWFGLGTVAGMLLVSLAVTGLSSATARSRPQWTAWIRAGAAMASIVIGAWLGWETVGGMMGPAGG